MTVRACDMTNDNGNNKVVLISLYSSDAIGLRYIYSLLKNNGIDVTLVFFKEKYLEADLMSYPTSHEHRLLIDLIENIAPSIVGISLRSSFFNIASLITKDIQREIEKPVIWGGTHPNVAPEESINVADMVCMGEGEYPMLELCQRISKGQSIDNIENLWIRKGQSIIRNPVRMLVRDLDSLPFPDYGKDGNYFIEENSILSIDPAVEAFNLDIMASRGCPYQCTYCCNSVFKEINKGKGPAIRRRSVDNVIEEIEYARDNFKNLQRIDFIDEVFAWDKSWTSEFSEKYREKIGLPFQCAQHPNMVDKEILRMLLDAGLERVEVGLQSGSEHIRRDVFKRPVSDKALLRGAKIISDLKVVPFYDVIVDNPFESEDDLRQGLDFILDILRPFHLRMFPLTYFPNTVLTQKALSTGVISADQVESTAQRTHNKWFVTLDYPWPDRERFWISLYSLTSKRFVPKGFIRYLSRRKYLRRHPQFLSHFATLCNNIKLGTIAVKWLLDGKPISAIFRQTTKGRSHWHI